MLQATAHYGLCTGKAQRESNPPAGLQNYSRANHGYYCSSATRLLSAALLGGEKGREQCLTGGATKLLIHQLHRTKGNTKPRAGLPNPASVQHHSCSDPPPSLSYKHTYLKKWFLFADAKSRIFQHNSADHDDIREF